MAREAYGWRGGCERSITRCNLIGEAVISAILTHSPDTHFFPPGRQISRLDGEVRRVWNAGSNQVWVVLHAVLAFDLVHVRKTFDRVSIWNKSCRSGWGGVGGVGGVCFQRLLVGPRSKVPVEIKPKVDAM